VLLHKAPGSGNVTLVRFSVVLDRLEIELDRLADVREGVVRGVAFADTAREGRDADGVAAVFTRFQDDAHLHGSSFLSAGCAGQPVSTTAIVAVE
jgi:hypothetical protein